MQNTPYLLPIKETIVSGWEKVSGAKGTVWAVLGISLLIGFGIGIVAGLASILSEYLSMAVNFAGQLVTTLLQIGLLYIGIRRGRNEDITYKQVFRAFEQPIALRIIGVYALQFLIYLPLMILFMILPMLYFGPDLSAAFTSGLTPPTLILVAWSLIGGLAFLYITLRIVLSMGLVIDKGVNPWPAIKMSFAATRDNVGRIFVLLLFQMLILIAAALTLGIGLIWMIPYSLTIYGTAYNKLLVNIPNEVSTDKRNI